MEPTSAVQVENTPASSDEDASRTNPITGAEVVRRVLCGARDRR